MNNLNNRFESLTVFVLASNETKSLIETVSQIKSLEHFEEICKIVLVIKNTCCPAYSEAKKLVSSSNDKLDIYIQKSNSIELCVAELPSLVKSSHFVIVAADGEMETKNIDVFISKAKESPEKIICASKWHKNSTVQGYGKFHEFGSRCIGWFISLLFTKKVSDPFSIYQIFPISVYNRLNYRNPKTFGYEYTIKALRNDIEYEEIPTFYRKRTEGETNFNYVRLFKTTILYCFTALKIRFEPKENS